MESSFVSLGGTRRAYYDVARRQVISRRQYLKRHGVFPRGGAHHSSRKASLGRVRPVTQRPQPFTKKVILSTDLVAEIHPRTAFLFEVVICHVRVAPLHLEQRGKRRHWHCGMGGCRNQYDNLFKMAHHCYEAHYLDACQLAGVGPRPILAVHEIHARERRARMGWRYESSEHDQLPVKRYMMASHGE